jgi:hypothetical protein
MNAWIEGARSTVSGTLLIQSGGVLKMFNPVVSGSASEEPDVELTNNGFTFAGFMVDSMNSTKSAATMTMDCTRT